MRKTHLYKFRGVKSVTFHVNLQQRVSPDSHNLRGNLCWNNNGYMTSCVKVLMLHHDDFPSDRKRNLNWHHASQTQTECHYDAGDDRANDLYANALHDGHNGRDDHNDHGDRNYHVRVCHNVYHSDYGYRDAYHNHAFFDYYDDVNY